MSYQRENDRKIRDAFKRFSLTKDQIIERGMRAVMEDAMNYALQIHDAGHWGHRSTGDSYGWALCHKRTIVALKVNEGHHGSGDAEFQLRTAAQGASPDGWTGILLASLRAETDRQSSILFAIDYEIGVLEFTKDELQDYFKTYFKPI